MHAWCSLFNTWLLKTSGASWACVIHAVACSNVMNCVSLQILTKFCIECPFIVGRGADLLLGCLVVRQLVVLDRLLDDKMYQQLLRSVRWTAHMFSLVQLGDAGGVSRCVHM
jgi:hypothetical protein